MAEVASRAVHYERHLMLDVKKRALEAWVLGEQRPANHPAAPATPVVVEPPVADRPRLFRVK
jgi:hypothetical protein